MALPKKNSRTINVEGKDYRYAIKVSANPNNEFNKENVLYVHEDVKGPGNLLVVWLDSKQVSYTAGIGVGPGAVKQIIEQSIIHGWEPSKKSVPFTPKANIEVVR